MYNTYKLAVIILCLFWQGCRSEQRLETAFQQLQENMANIASFKERCETIVKDPGENGEKPIAAFYLGRLNELFGHYDEAIKQYRYLLTAFPEHTYCSESLYRIGYIDQNNIGDKTKAKEAYYQLICMYPASSFAEQALINHAQLSCEQNAWQQAMDSFNQYLTKYPASKITEDIKYRLADIMQSGIKDTVQAAVLYEQFLADYPHSSWCIFAEKKLEAINNPEIRRPSTEVK
jgi:TolA-binding protein